MGEFYKAQYGINVISLMPCNLYGKNDSFDPINSHVLSALVKKFCDAKVSNKSEVVLWGSGIAEREFLNVKDLAKIVCYFVLNEVSIKSSFINIGSGKSISIKKLAFLIREKVGFKGQIFWDESRPDGMLKKCLDISEMRSLGFKETISLSLQTSNY